MTTDTETLRTQFERRMNLRGWSEANIRRDGLDYTSTQITEAWHAFQAGYAAAKAETAAAVATEREHCALVCEDVRRAVAEINGAGVAAAQQCADAIRAGAKETIDGKHASATLQDKPIDDGGPLYPVHVRSIVGDTLAWVPKSQVDWYKQQESARATSAPGLWDGH